MTPAAAAAIGGSLLRQGSCYEVQIWQGRPTTWGVHVAQGPEAPQQLSILLSDASLEGGYLTCVPASSQHMKWPAGTSAVTRPLQ